MARLAAKAKLLYYPTPLRVVEKLKAALVLYGDEPTGALVDTDDGEQSQDGGAQQAGRV
jgi:hypothetical protein